MIDEMEFDNRGGCACGEIKYHVSSKPLAMFNCHCVDCQKASGGTFVSVALFRESDLNIISGSPRYHRVHGESGRWTDRGFCHNCGTPLFAKGEIAPGLISIKPGSLYDASWFKPTIDTWAGCAPSWLVLDGNLPKHDRTPNVLKQRIE